MSGAAIGDAAFVKVERSGIAGRALPRVQAIW